MTVTAPKTPALDYSAVAVVERPQVAPAVVAAGVETIGRAGVDLEFRYLDYSAAPGLVVKHSLVAEPVEPAAVAAEATSSMGEVRSVQQRQEEADSLLQKEAEMVVNSLSLRIVAVASDVQTTGR